MQTTLKRIDEQVEAKIAAVESGAERPAAPRMEPVSIVGFAIPEVLLRPDHEEACTKLALARVSDYRQLASELRVRLMGVGIEPLAILPAKAWYELCDRSGLYLLYPNQAGGVQLDCEALVERLRAARPPLVDAVVGVVSGLAAGSGAYALLSLLSVSDGLYFCTLVAGLAGGWIGAIASHNFLKSRRFARNLRRYLAARSWADVLADLAPKRRIFGGHNDGWAGWNGVKLELPAPPAAVAEVLLRAQRAKLYLRVAAEAGAVQFRGGIEKVLGEEYRRVLIAEEYARRDPIVFVEHGGKALTYEDPTAVVAVIAQFGDFPIEQAAVDEVVGRGVL